LVYLPGDSGWKHREGSWSIRDTCLIAGLHQRLAKNVDDDAERAMVCEMSNLVGSISVRVVTRTISHITSRDCQ
jgi:hypothetical protein